MRPSPRPVATPEPNHDAASIGDIGIHANEADMSTPMKSPKRIPKRRPSPRPFPS